MRNNVQFEAAYNKATAAGRAAGQAAVPAPMVVGTPTTPFGNDIDPNEKTYYVADGVCGFAWVKITPGNCAFANWLKKNKLARTAYQGGVDIWISAFGQSMQRKEACAAAMAKIFRDDLGVKAYAGSRMD